MYEYFIWAAKLVCVRDGDRMIELLRQHFESEAAIPKSASTATLSASREALIKKVKDTREKIAQKIEKLKDCPTLTKNSRKRLKKNLSKMRKQLVKFFAVGIEVTIRGLDGEPNLNDTVGTIISIIHSDDNENQFVVRCSDGEKKKINLCNLDIRDSQQNTTRPPVAIEFKSMQEIVTGLVLAAQTRIGAEQAKSFCHTLARLQQSDCPRVQQLLYWVGDPKSECAGLVSVVLMLSKSSQTTEQQPEYSNRKTKRAEKSKQRRKKKKKKKRKTKRAEKSSFGLFACLLTCLLVFCLLTCLFACCLRVCLRVCLFWWW